MDPLSQHGMLALERIREAFEISPQDDRFRDLQSALRRLTELEMKERALLEPDTSLRAMRLRQYVSFVHEQQEEIIRAFVAKFGCQPDELMMVERQTENGRVWHVEFNRTHQPWTDAPTGIGWHWLREPRGGSYQTRMVWVWKPPKMQGELCIEERISGHSPNTRWIKVKDISGRWLFLPWPDGDPTNSFDDLVMSAG